MNLSTASNTVVLNSGSAAGVTTVDSTGLDMAQYEGAKINVVFGTITATAVTSVKLQHSDDNSTYADVVGSSVTVADTDSGKVVVIGAYRPQKRYIRVRILRATANSVVAAVVATQYEPKKLPVTQGSTVIGLKTLVSAASGTA